MDVGETSSGVRRGIEAWARRYRETAVAHRRVFRVLLACGAVRGCGCPDYRVPEPAQYTVSSTADPNAPWRHGTAEVSGDTLTVSWTDDGGIDWTARLVLRNISVNPPVETGQPADSRDTGETGDTGAGRR